MSAPDGELAGLRRRVGRLELTAWVERALIGYLLYLSWDRVPELGVAVIGLLAVLLIAFAVIERVRR